MKARPIAAQFIRAFTGIFDRAHKRTPEQQSTPSQQPQAAAPACKPTSEAAIAPRGMEYLSTPGATSQADASKILKDHRADLTAAIDSGVFVTQIR